MRDGAFAAPGLFDVLVDRIRATAYPSDRWIASAALSARTVEQLDRLIEAVGRTQFQLHLSPRRLELLGMITNRRLLLPGATELARRHRPDDDVRQIQDAVGLLDQTAELMS